MGTAQRDAGGACGPPRPPLLMRGGCRPLALPALKKIDQVQSWSNRKKALEVPELKTQESMKNDAPKAWELEYEHVHGQTDSAESR